MLDKSDEKSEQLQVHKGKHFNSVIELMPDGYTRVLRIVFPGEWIQDDYMTHRITILCDKDGIIERIYMG